MERAITISANARKAMDADRQKAGYVIDVLVDALGNYSSSPIRRAIILVDLHQNPDSTLANIENRLDIPKSALKRDIDWLFNYGCISKKDNPNDKRNVLLNVCGHAQNAVQNALNYITGNHENLKNFLKRFINIIGGKNPTMREAKILTVLFEKGKATKQEIMAALYAGSSATESRAISGLVEDGLIEDKNGRA